MLMDFSIVSKPWVHLYMHCSVAIVTVSVSFLSLSLLKSLLLRSSNKANSNRLLFALQVCLEAYSLLICIHMPII